MIDKTYQPSEVEDRIYRAWEQAGAFESGRAERKGADPYCIVIPPPNVTGSLHMGHALNNTLQDILCRFERMRGKDVLWQPGTDHAGIATQMVVERQLAERQQPGRRDMTRKDFVDLVWKWKEESGGTIIRQLKKLGASCDWRRERFTMDEGLSKAVLEVFVSLHKAGLIYRDKRLVNWDPKLLTAISDLEVQQVECKGSFKWSNDEKDADGNPKPLDVAALEKALKKNPNGHMYYFRYPLKTKVPGYDKDYIVVATTRPETMLGDTAVAVHPEDERYTALLKANASVMLPLVGREIPVIGDEYSDKEKGTGAVKITPAHDFNDFDVGKRHGRELINIFTSEAKLNENVPQQYRGMDRFEARTKIVADLAEFGLVEKIEPHTHQVPHGDRSGVVVEPYLTDQWYVDAKKMAVDALAAVKDGRTVFVPKNWEKTYFDWLENIEPWCVSRQLWWGHQIPAWYGPSLQLPLGHPHLYERKVFVEESEEKVRRAAEEHYRTEVYFVSEKDQFQKAIEKFVLDNPDNGPLYTGPVPLWRDEDVLDTWFSSALWPFSTLGWPEKTKELERFYPTSVLVTGFDIIFFWVARMMMMGLYFQKEVPFHTVYIHALVRDEKGAKMSKSKGNVIDPLSIIDELGADALRFTLASMAAQGRDIKLSMQRVEGNRNFATKLWNAARFGEFNGAFRVAGFDPKGANETLNKWILAETEKALGEITKAIEAYRFNDAANAAYRFVWSVYCDWYIELAKPALTGPDGAAKDETRATTTFVLDEILKLLHPFMPFLTEELWRVTGETGPKRQTMLALSEWPRLSGLQNEQAENEIGWLVDLVSAIRSVRSEMNVPAGSQIPLALVASKETKERAGRWDDALKRLARLADISFIDTPPAGSVQLLVRGEVAALPLKGVIDLDAERVRLQKELGKVADDIKRIDAKLGNHEFVAKAPEEVIDEQRERREEAEERGAKIREALERLKGAA
jgi:valyl-tRNA synthetase